MSDRLARTRLATPRNSGNVELRSFNHKGYQIPSNLITSVMAGENATPLRGIHILTWDIWGKNITNTFGLNPGTSVLPFQSEDTIHPRMWNKSNTSSTYVPENSRVQATGETFQQVSENNLKEWYRANLWHEFRDASGEKTDAFFRSHCFTIDATSTYSPATLQEALDFRKLSENPADLAFIKRQILKSSMLTSTAAFVSFLSLLRSNGFVEGKDYYLASDETTTRSSRPGSTYASRPGKKAIFMSNTILSSKEKMAVIMSFNPVIVAIERFLTMKYGDLDCIGLGDASELSRHIFVEVIGFASFDDLKENQHDLEFSDSRYRAWKAWLFNTAPVVRGFNTTPPFTSLSEFASTISLDLDESREDTESFLKRYSRTDSGKPGTLNVYGYYTIQQRRAQPLYSSNPTRRFSDIVYNPGSLIGEIQPVGITLDGSEPDDLSEVIDFESTYEVLLDLISEDPDNVVARTVKSRFMADFGNNVELTSLPPWFIQYSALPNSMVFGEYFHPNELIIEPAKVTNLGSGAYGSVIKTSWKASRSSLFTPAGKLRASGKHAFNHHNLILDTLMQKRQDIIYMNALELNGVDVKVLYKDSLNYVPVEKLSLNILRWSKDTTRTVQIIDFNFSADSTVADYDNAIFYIQQAVCRDCVKKNGQVDVNIIRTLGHESFNTIVPSKDVTVIAYDTAVSVSVALKLSDSQQQLTRKEFCLIKALFPRSKVAKHSVTTYNLMNTDFPFVETSATEYRKGYKFGAGNLRDIQSWGILTVQDQMGVASLKIFVTPVDDPKTNRVIFTLNLKVLNYNTADNVVIEPEVAKLTTDGINKPYGIGYDSSIIFTVIPYRLNGDLYGLLRNSRRDDQVRQSNPNLEVNLQNIVLVQNYFKSNLGDTKKPLTLYEFLSIMLDVARALNTMNSKGVMHGDMKEPNILVGSRGEGYVTDFSLSTPYGSPVAIVGTRGYVPPTIGVQDFDNAKQSELFTPVDTYVDAFSFSVILRNYLDINFQTEDDIWKLSYYGCCYNQNMVQHALDGEIKDVFKTSQNLSCLMSSKIRFTESSKVLASTAQLSVDFLKLIKDDLTMLADLMSTDYLGEDRPDEADLLASMNMVGRPSRKIVTDFGSRELLQKGCTRFYIAEVVISYLMKSIVLEAQSDWGGEDIVDNGEYELFTKWK